MAIELCSDSTGISPRISFSHDLSLSDVVPIEHHPLRSNSSGGSLDFDFCVRKSFDQESSSADELFSDGKILPTEVKKKSTSANHRKKQKEHGTDNQSMNAEKRCLSDGVSSHNGDNSRKVESLKEMKCNSSGSDEMEQSNKQSSKSFWKFKRSSSLNCGSGYGGSLCPLPLLSRSNSTGSTPSVKRGSMSSSSSASSSKDSHYKQQHKQAFIKSSQVSSSTSYQKPPLKKSAASSSSYGYYGNGVQVNPVLNVPSGNLFGLGSIFFNGKDKNKKK